MAEELIFSARYSIPPGLDHSKDPEFDPEQWASDFQDAYEDRSVLARRLIETARLISRLHTLDMDIFDSPLEVRIDLYLDFTPLFSDAMKAIAALLNVCDTMTSLVQSPSEVCISLTYDRTD